jgi:hypothetical protein
MNLFSTLAPSHAPAPEYLPALLSDGRIVKIAHPDHPSTTKTGHPARCPKWVDAVEKVGPSIGINALGIFDPAETGRRFGFTAA